MAGNNLSLAIVVKLLTDNFTKGATHVKATLLTMQRNFLAFATAAGAGTLGLTNFISRMVSVAKETSRANIALKNVSGTTGAFAENQKWLLDVAKRYGVEINALTSGFAKFKAAADISNMSLEDQRKIFESVARASVAFGLSAEDQRGIFMALSQMMSKNKVMAEELRLQMAERMPIAIQAMEKAAGATVGELDALMEQGKVMSSDVLPRFADALNEMIADPDMNNLNKSLVDLSNTFQQMTKNLGIEDMFKRVVETATRALSALADNVGAVMSVVKAALYGAFGKGVSSIFKGFSEDYERAVSAAVKKVEGGERAIKRLQKAESEYRLAVREQAAATEAYKTMTAETSANERIAIEARVKNANEKVKKAETKVFKAEEAQKVAAAKASAEEQILAAQATATGWTKAINKMKFAFASFWNGLKAMVSANIWGAIISGIGLLADKLWGVVASTRESINAVNALKNTSSTDEEEQIKPWRALLSSSDENTRSGALQKINSILGTQLTFEDDINSAIEKRLELIREEERLRKADEAVVKAQAEVDKEGTGELGWDFAQRKKDLEYAKSVQAEAAENVARLQGELTQNNTGSSNTVLGGNSHTPVKVEVVNLDLEDIEQESFEDYVDRINKQIGGTTPRFADPSIIEAITSRQRDRSGDWKMSNLEILEADQLFAQQKVDDLLNYAQQTGVELGNVLSEAISESTNLAQALGLAEKQNALSELQKEMDSLKFDLIEGGIQGIDGLVSAFERLSDAMEDDATAWEQIMAVWGIFESSAIAVMDTIQAVAAMSEMAAQIKRTTAAQNVASDTAEAAAETGKGVAKQAPGFAALVAVPAAIAAIIAAFAIIPKFANGGIVGGTSTHGDKILARLNSGEGVLTPEGLASLHDAANPRNARAVQVVGRLVGRGRDLVAVIDTENKYKTRTR